MALKDGLICKNNILEGETAAIRIRHAGYGIGFKSNDIISCDYIFSDAVPLYNFLKFLKIKSFKFPECCI